MKNHNVEIQDNSEASMDTRKMAAEYRLSHWAQVMSARVERGTSIREFCDAEGINENTYFYWQRKLREAAGRGILPAAQCNQEKAAPRGWVLCHSEQELAKDPDGFLAIEIGNCRVLADSSTDMTLLSKVCKTLAALC
jgi:putative transposase